MVSLKRWLVMAIVAMIMLLSSVLAFAAEYPQVSNLKPFSEEANFMSLAGYLRYLVFQKDNVWISRQEAERIVKQQKGM